MEFTVQTVELKKALSIVSLATGDKVDTLISHALFRVKGGVVRLFATDGDRFALASLLPIEPGPDAEFQFTADPKKLTTLLNGSSAETIRMAFNEADNTLQVYASESSESHVSFASFKPEKALPFEDELTAMQDLKTVNAELLIKGIKFAQGFKSQEENNRKFSCVYLSNGVLYGSNGFNMVGAFKTPQFDGVELLLLRGSMLPQLLQAVDRFKTGAIALRSTSKFIAVFSPDGETGFGFLKSNEQMPRLPIELERPKWDSFSVDRELLLKKLDRLALAAGEAVAIKASVGPGTMQMATANERPSTEDISIKRTQGAKDVTLAFDYRVTEPALRQYWAKELDLYVNNSRCCIFCDGQIAVNEKESLSFLAVCVFGLSKNE